MQHIQRNVKKNYYTKIENLFIIECAGKNSAGKFLLPLSGSVSSSSGRTFYSLLYTFLSG